MDLVSLTPEGRILLTLTHGQHTYAELKFESGLSDRWLTVKLKELRDRGLAVKNGRWYGAGKTVEVSSFERSLYMRSQARRYAEELGAMAPVRLVVLFGSVAQGKAQDYSDLDLIIVVSGSAEAAKETVLPKIRLLEKRYHFIVEPLILSQQDFLSTVQSHEGGVIFGLADGFEVLQEKNQDLAEALRNRVTEIKRTYTRIDEEQIWLKAR